MPGSSPSRRAAPSNSWSIALKTLPCPSMSLPYNACAQRQAADGKSQEATLPWRGGECQMLCRVAVAALAIVATTWAATAQEPATPVTLALVNGRIYTMDPARPWVEALAV